MNIGSLCPGGYKSQHNCGLIAAPILSLMSSNVLITCQNKTCCRTKPQTILRQLHSLETHKSDHYAFSFTAIYEMAFFVKESFPLSKAVYWRSFQISPRCGCPLFYDWLKRLCFPDNGSYKILWLGICFCSFVCLFVFSDFTEISFPTNLCNHVNFQGWCRRHC